MTEKGILQINEILNDYSEEVQKGIETIAQEVAKDDVNALKNANTYHIRSGDYNKSWTVKTTRGVNSISCIVHNKEHYRLTHLLEKGHNIVGRNGSIVGRAKAFPHIAPVEQNSNSTYERKVTELIRNGG